MYAFPPYPRKIDRTDAHRTPLKKLTACHFEANTSVPAIRLDAQHKGSNTSPHRTVNVI